MKTIFEIPIYSMSPSDFVNRWGRKKEKMYKTFLDSGYPEEEANCKANELHYPPYGWQYNWIIGYIQISVNSQQVYFDVFCSQKKSYRIDSHLKDNIRQVNSNNINVENKTDKYIKRAIKNTLEHIEKDYLQPKFFLDYSIFNNLIEYINIKKIMCKLRA